MPLNTQTWDALEANFIDMLASDLTKVMEYTEEEIKERHRWGNDTGSLEASIRGYVVGRTNPFEHFDDPRWRAAQSGAIESRYLAAYPQNTPEHYQPFVQSGSAGEDENTLVGVLTAFVDYAEEVENDLRIGGTFSEAMYDTLQRNLDGVFHSKSGWNVDPFTYKDPMQQDLFTK